MNFAIAFMINLLTCVHKKLVIFFRYIAICHPFLHYKYSSYKQKITVVTTVVIWLVGSLIGIRDLVHVRLSKSIEDVPELNEVFKEVSYFGIILRCFNRLTNFSNVYRNRTL